jgi:hypothetical protein
MNTKKQKIKQKITDEFYRFLIYFSFLAIFFCSLTTYRRLILGEYSINYLHYGYGLLHALIISKIILIGESLKLGGKFENKPLIIPTLYKTIIFSVLVLIFTVLEHFVTGFFEGIRFEKVYEDFLNKGFDEIFAKILVVFSVFILFFAFLETAYVLGEHRLIKLFFGTKKDSDFPNQP